MNNDILSNLKKWFKSNGLNPNNAEKFYDNINAGDLVTLMTAFNNNDLDTVAQIYNKTKAEMSSSYGVIKDSFSNLRMNDITSLYQRLPISSVRTNHLSESHIRTLIFDSINEGIVSSMNAAKSSTGSVNTPKIQPQNNQQLSNPQNTDDNEMSIQQKQQALTQNKNLKVTTGGIGSEEDVLGTQFDPSNPQNSLVVVKDPSNQNKVQVLNLNDVNVIDQEQ